MLATEQVNKLKEENTLHIACSEKDKLIDVLELNELRSSEKIKSLQSELKEYSNKINDMHRQILEKETSISELEKALCDIQEKIKNVEDQNKKLVFDLNQQHEGEIKEFMNLKQMAEKENIRLKSENDELKKQVGNTEVETSKTTELEQSKTKRTKRSALAKIDNNSDNKENSDSNESLKESDKSNQPRRTRRALRQRQAEANMDDSDLDGQSSKQRKRKSSDEFLPAKKVQKKTSRTTNKPATRKATNERLVKKNVRAGEENMSPVQKIAAFMGSTIRSVAQAMPSPRLTRGRKRLFNVDTASASKPWQY